MKKEIRVRRFVPVLAALVLNASNASAQSVLERVLGQIDGATNLAQVNGVYANIAESVGPSDSPGVVIPGTTTTASVAADFSTAPLSTRLFEVFGSSGAHPITVGDIGTTFTAGDGTGIGSGLSPRGSITVNDNGSITVDRGTGDDVVVLDLATGDFIEVTGSPETLPISTSALVYDVFGTLLLVNPDEAARMGFTTPVLVDVTTTTADTFIPGIPGLATTIDGSITNIITGVSAATAEAVAGAVTATEFTLPTFDLGDMATTALGAVNTGEITLGVNSAVDDASTSTTNAISAAMTQIGGSADTGALVLNVASNASAVNGSIQNTLLAVNGSVGDASTTALGAVNTGTITSGVNAAVQGIVGMSGQSGL